MYQNHQNVFVQNNARQKTANFPYTFTNLEIAAGVYLNSVLLQKKWFMH
jgi:hypothetical protein